MVRLVGFHQESYLRLFKQRRFYFWQALEMGGLQFKQRRFYFWQALEMGGLHLHPKGICRYARAYSLTALDGSIAISALARKVFFQLTRFCGRMLCLLAISARVSAFCNNSSTSFVLNAEV